MSVDVRVHAMLGVRTRVRVWIEVGLGIRVGVRARSNLELLVRGTVEGYASWHSSARCKVSQGDILRWRKPR